MIALADLHRENPTHYMRKFFESPERWIRIAESIAVYLGLDRPPKGLRILDIGCGVGQFVRVCNGLGHSAVGINMPDPVIEQAASVYGVKYRPYIIEVGNPLPYDLAGFDLITMFGVSLKLYECEYWTWREWEPFGLDVMSRLVVGGRWVLRPNKEPGPDIVLDIEHWVKCLPNAKVEKHGLQVTITRTR